VILAPRYDGPSVLSIGGPVDDQLAPLTRQRRRMQAMLADLDDTDWATASRCNGWAVRDVVAHVAGVNRFWRGSVVAGLAGTPTRVLGGFFDPAVTPSLMVDQMSALSAGALLEELVSTNEAFLEVVAELNDDGWSTTAESPAGHVSIRLLAQHALWDSWIHERDIALPLGIAMEPQADELSSCLRYAAAVSPVLGIGLQHACRGTFAVEATDPSIRFVLDVAESVAVRDDDAPANAPCLRGDAIALIEALSLRAPMPASTPPEWSQLLGGLQTAFDS
jgi:uncharacterized protein (TIGR03083 family)